MADHSHGIIKDHWTKTVTRSACESQGILTEEGTRADPQRMSLIFPMEETIGIGFQELKGMHSNQKKLHKRHLAFRLLWLTSLIFLKKYACMVCNAPN